MEDTVYRYVYDHVKNVRFGGNYEYNKKLENEEFVKNVSDYITKELYKVGVAYRYMELYLGEYDYDINKMIRMCIIKQNSTVSYDKPKSHRYNVTGILKDNRMRALILAAFIFASTTIGLSKNSHNTNIAVDNVVYAVADNYEFPRIFSSDNENFSNTLNASVEFYNNVIENNNYSDNIEYRYLGIFEAYRSMQQDSLDIMDKMLKTIKNRSDYYMLNSPSLYNNVSRYDCFLEFVNDRVYELTGEKVNGIEEVLFEYRNLMNSNQSTPYDGLSNSSQKKIDKLMSLYIEASENLEEDFAKIHNNEKEGRSR